MATPIPDNNAPFTLAEIVEATSGEVLLTPQGGASASGVTTDTRGELEGKVFVALRGENFDAHAYLSQAVQAGARILIVQQETSVSFLMNGKFSAVGVVLVKDTLTALGKLARFHRERWAGRMAAVAGSAGKTTTRSVISSLLSLARPGKVHSTQGNLNNRIGVPMTLLGLTAETEFAVVEIGTNTPGEVRELAAMTQPDVAVLTLIDLEHTEGLGDLTGVEKEERAIFSAMAGTGVAIGFGEDERVHRSVQLANCAERILYGFEKERDLQICDREILRPGWALVVLERKDGSRLSINTPLAGRPGALALAAGVACVESLLGERLQQEACSQAIASAGEPGRNSLVELPGPRYVIDDTYNSNPISVLNSVSTGLELSQKCGGNLWLVLGEMLELGELSEVSHRKMGKMAAQSGAKGAFFVQGQARLALSACQESLEHAEYFSSSKEVVAHLGPMVELCDVVVVKASRGVRAERVVEDLVEFFSTTRKAGSS